MHSEEAKTRAAHCDDSDSWCRFVSILRSLRAVSYTHLDVYKRQPIIIWIKLSLVKAISRQ